MHLIFNTLLPLFLIVAIFVGISLVRRSSLAHKKRWNGCIIAAGVALAILSGQLIYLVPFSSPEDAFIAMHSESRLLEEELLTIEGETSAWVLGSDTAQFVKRDGNGWKLAGVRDFSSPFYMTHADNITILVEGLSSSRDRYICVIRFPVSEDCRFDTPPGTVFYERSDPETVRSEARARHFYAYIGSLEEDYEFTVNDTSFRIPKAAELSTPEPVWPQFLPLFGTLAIIIVGSIWIIRIRSLSRGKKALLIFLLILFAMFLNVFLMTLLS